jgi:oligopeptide/dipeptide ABC transporter ATP-binding protein
VTTDVEVQDLRVGYETPGGLLQAVRGIDLVVAAGERVGLVGESGCGKSSVVSAVLGLLPGNARVQGRIRVGEQTIDATDRPTLATLRGSRIAAVPQGAMAGLHPAHRAADQVAEVVRLHTDASSEAALARANELLGGVGLDERARRAFPHELSGGMRQRVAFAASLAASPELVIADEPTIGLDAVTADRFLKLLLRRQADDGFGLLLVSHDLRSVATACDRLIVTYAGEAVESGTTAALLHEALHPYTAGLLAAAPSLDGRGWSAIPGSAPDLVDPPKGCGFADRCPHRQDACGAVPVTVEIGGRHVRCHLHEQSDVNAPPIGIETSFPTVTRRRSTNIDHGGGRGGDDRRLIVSMRGVTKTYRSRRWFQLTETPAVREVDLDLWAGEIVGLVGSSGSGKSTLARTLFGLVEPDAGSIRIEGEEIVGARRSSLRRIRHRLALVHQDPFASLHPGMRIRSIVEEPLVIADVPPSGRVAQVRRALELAGLDPTDDLLRRHPDQLSGGQRQRVALARGLVVEPAVLVLDEPMSMLDASIRAGIAGALLDARDELESAIVLITHDLAEAAGTCDRIVVLDHGRIGEEGPTDDLIADPRHQATAALLALASDPLTDTSEDAHV